MGIDLSKMSKLGFGLMRLPEKDGVIEIERVKSMVDKYMDSGMNYFDTAYVYHGGKSEVAAREALVKRYPRESFMIATKRSPSLSSISCKSDSSFSARRIPDPSPQYFIIFELKETIRLLRTTAFPSFIFSIVRLLGRDPGLEISILSSKINRFIEAFFE